MTRRMRLTGIVALALVGAGSAALGAELPAKSAAAVEPVRACTSQGAGFFSVPGSETCVKVSGRVRSDYLVGQARSRVQDSSGFVTGGRVQLDARTPTPYGPLRAVVRYDTRAMKN
jgi:hypothetical protein